MPSDIKLDGNDVLIEGNKVAITGEDLELRSPPIVRKMAPNEYLQNKPRRALKHGSKDQLVLNGDSDYKFTEIDGVLEIRAKNMPATIYMKDKKGKTEVFISLGLIECTRDLKIKNLATTSGSESVLQTLKWLATRVSALEKKLGLPKAAKVVISGRG